MNRNFLTFSLLACGKNVISVFFCRILNNSLGHCCFCYEIGSKLFGTSIEIYRSLTFKFDGRNNFCDLSWQLLCQWIYQKFSKIKKKNDDFCFLNRFDFIIIAIIALNFEVRALLFLITQFSFFSSNQNKEMAKVQKIVVFLYFMEFHVFLVKTKCYTALALLNLFVFTKKVKSDVKCKNHYRKLSQINIQGRKSRVIILCYYENANLRTFLIDVSTPSKNA